MIEASGVDLIVLHVNDVERSMKFYTEIFGMTVYGEDDGQVFLHAGQQGRALFKKPGTAPLTAEQDLNHLAFNLAAGAYESPKAELEQRWAPVSDRSAQDRCICFRDPDGHRLQLMERA